MMNVTGKKGFFVGVRTRLSCLWRAVRAFFAKRDPVCYFIALLALGEVAFFVTVLALGESALLSVFFRGGADLHMDFFHSLRDAAQGAAVYSERRVIYPPLANALLWLISRALPASYLATDKTGGVLLWRYHPAAMLSLLFFTVATTVAFSLLLRREPHGKRAAWLAFLLPVSFPMLFMMERGNVVVLALLALIVYMQNYDAESALAREVGLFSLAVAAALKVYPAIFGLVLLRDRRYRDAARAAGYAFSLFLLPSFFFGGPLYAAYWLIRNTLAYSGSTAANGVGFIGMLGGSPALSRAVLLLLYLLLFAFVVVYTLKEPCRSRSFAVAGAALLTVSSIFSAYNFLLLLPALLLFLREGRLVGVRWVYFFLLSLPFYTFLPKAWQDNALIALIALLLILAAWRLWRLFSGKVRD